MRRARTALLLRRTSWEMHFSWGLLQLLQHPRGCPGQGGGGGGGCPPPSSIPPLPERKKQGDKMVLKPQHGIKQLQVPWDVLHPSAPPALGLHQPPALPGQPETPKTHRHNPRVGASLPQPCAPCRDPRCSLRLPRAGSGPSDHPAQPSATPKSQFYCLMCLPSSHPGGKCGLGGGGQALAPACSWEGRTPRQCLGSA